MPTTKTPKKKAARKAGKNKNVPARSSRSRASRAPLRSGSATREPSPSARSRATAQADMLAIETAIDRGIAGKLHVLNNTVMDLRNNLVQHRDRMHDELFKLAKKVDFVNEDIVAQIEADRTAYRSIERKLDILLPPSSLKQELEAKKEEQGKWVPKVGDKVVRTEKWKDASPIAGFPLKTDEQVGEVKKVDDHRNTNWPGIDLLIKGAHYTYASDRFRPATQAEIDAQEKEGLENGDRCKCSGDELAAIMDLAQDAGLLQFSDPWRSCIRDYTLGVQVVGGKVWLLAEWEGSGGKMTTAVFKKLLIKTIEKLRSAREEEEAKKKLEFGTRVKWKDDGLDVEGRIASFCEDSAKNWLVMPEGWGPHGTLLKTRSELTVLNN